MKKKMIAMFLAVGMITMTGSVITSEAAPVGGYDASDDTSYDDENNSDDDNSDDGDSDSDGNEDEGDGENGDDGETGDDDTGDGDSDEDEEPEFDDDVLIEVGANDSLEIATELTNGKAEYGAIATKEDVDFYKYNMEEAGHFSFTFNNIDSSKGKWKVTILDYAGEEMSSFTTSSKKQIYETQNYNFGTGEKSTVYVQVEYGNCLDDMYTITVNAEEDDTWEQEPNNSYKKAFKIKKGTTYSGNLCSASDKDFYVYKPTAKGTAKLRFSLDDQDEDIENGWNLYVYNSAKKLVKSAKNIKNDNTIGFKVQKNSTYYIIVKPASKSKAPVGADYELRIK